MTHKWSAFVFNIGIDYKEDTDRVVAVLRQVGDELRRDTHFGPLMQEGIEIFGVDKLAESAVMVQGRLKTQPNKQMEVGREFQRRVKKAFEQNNIEFPYAQMTLNFGATGKPVLVPLLESSQREREKETPPQQ